MDIDKPVTVRTSCFRGLGYLDPLTPEEVEQVKRETRPRTRERKVRLLGKPVVDWGALRRYLLAMLEVMEHRYDPRLLQLIVHMDVELADRDRLHTWMLTDMHGLILELVLFAGPPVEDLEYMAELLQHPRLTSAYVAPNPSNSTGKGQSADEPALG